MTVDIWERFWEKIDISTPNGDFSTEMREFDTKRGVFEESQPLTVISRP
ncbi:MAG: hypothetical protein PWP76_311 [Candidatus Diapherotrites archaeon]|nr:hypothetical protein [Candidatus Diapherotrites archaeon]MDN5366831.1 hypothetical protein [Candidatus Diapherotrites archaeon]